MSLKRKSLIGVWKCADAFGSTVEYRIRKTDRGLNVSAHDPSDGENAEVFDIRWKRNTSTISFATHWKSTGRFLRCRLSVTTDGQAQLTYTYTATDLFVRKPQAKKRRKSA